MAKDTNDNEYKTEVNNLFESNVRNFNRVFDLFKETKEEITDLKLEFANVKGKMENLVTEPDLLKNNVTITKYVDEKFDKHNQQKHMSIYPKMHQGVNDKMKIGAAGAGGAGLLYIINWVVTLLQSG